MKAIAKVNFGYDMYPYTNWKKGNEYPCEIKDNGNKIDVEDEEGVIFHFVGNAKKHLDEVFEFVQ